jgi:hypothetical protein
MLEPMGAKVVLGALVVALFLCVLLLRVVFGGRRPPATSPAYFNLDFTAKTTNVEEIRQMLEKAKANYKGKDPEAFSRTIDGFVVSLRAQYGGQQIPVLDALESLRKLERATFVNPFLSPPDPPNR